MSQSKRGPFPNSFACLGFGCKGFVYKRGGAKNLGLMNLQEDARKNVATLTHLKVQGNYSPFLIVDGPDIYPPTLGVYPEL